MAIKLIVTDMDGTLLRRDNTISEYTKEVLIRAQEQGIILVMASGRNYRKLLPYAEQLQMKRFGGYFIEVNGVAVYRCQDDDRQRYVEMKAQEAKQIFTKLLSYEVEMQAMGDDFIYDYIPEAMMEDKIRYRKEHNLPDDCPWTGGAFTFIMDNRIGYPHQVTIHSADELPPTMNKLAVSHLPHRLQTLLPAIREELKDDYWTGLTSPGWLEVMPKGVTKGAALQRLCASLGIEAESVMAFGDGENDLEMLRWAGHGVAMANGLDSVRAMADEVCPSNEADGLAQTIAKYIG